EAFHQLLVTRNGDHITVQLDGVNMVSATNQLDGQAGRLGTFSEQTRAEFGYQALTPYYEDTFDSPESAAAWERRSGTWLVEEGALHQVQGGGGLNVALKGDPAENYEFLASLRWRDNDQLNSSAGVVAAESDGEMLIGGFEKNIWPFARFWVRDVKGGKITKEFAVGLPRGFLYDEYHTIRVVKQGSAFTFYLDGKEVAATRANIGAARPGLFTDGVRAGFDDVSMKQMVVARNLLLNPGFETEQWADAKATADNPWVLSGTARVNDCCAHSGLRRLLIPNGEGEARQEITPLAAGRYRLTCWVISTAGAQAQISVDGLGGPTAQAPAGGEQWHRVSLDFTVPEGQHSATIHFSGKAATDFSQYIAADDFYLFKQ
ncbi:MAG: hypothetical protein JO187_04490, partial [Acidobacteria bacterium]|nr:hypothetical protein [Acidobacteriota bacterium]